MSEQPPESTGGGSGLKKKYGGIPVWGYGVGLVVAIAAYTFIRLRSASKAAAAPSTSTSEDVSASGTTGDETGLSEYEQVSAQLTGIEGNNAAILAAIADMNGAGSTAAAPPSSAAATIKVPAVTGDEKRVAGPKITAAGLKPKFSSKSEGTISAQAPPAGTKVAAGTTVDLTVKPKSGSGSASAGSAPSGTTSAGGGSAAGSSGTSSAGSSGTSSATGGAAGPVTSGAGSTGKASTGQATVPNVVGQEKRTAGPAVTSAGLRPKFSTTADGTISGQSPKAGSKVARNSVVALSVKKK